MNRHAKFSEEVRPEGRYANYIESGHNAFEFILDFGQCHEDNEEAVFHTRIITAPVYAKAFYKTLHNAIQEYEKAFGSIGNEELNH